MADRTAIKRLTAFRIACVTVDCGVELFLPEVYAGRGGRGQAAARMPVPETSPDFDYLPAFGENNIRSPWKRSCMKAISVPMSVK